MELKFIYSGFLSGALLLGSALSVSAQIQQGIIVPEGLSLPDLPTISLPPISSNVAPASPFSELNDNTNFSAVNLSDLQLSAQLTSETGVIENGLVWRIFSPDPDEHDKLPLIASSSGGSASFSLPEGSYLVHVAFGRAGATKRITMRNADRQENIILDAGGLKLNAKFADGKTVPDKYLRFSIYEGDEDQSERSLILPDIKPDTIIRLNSGRYHVISNYGNANATVRADIRVAAGKLTEVSVEHNAAEITIKLIRDQGGEALADTSWSILNASGDIVHENVGAYASLVLAAGDYVAIAKNKDRLYQREFTVTSGKNEDVDVLATPASEVNDDAFD